MTDTSKKKDKSSAGNSRTRLRRQRRKTAARKRRAAEAEQNAAEKAADPKHRSKGRRKARKQEHRKPDMDGQVLASAGDSQICTYLRELIAGTQWEGHLFVVGGCCRDIVMGRPIHDLDLTVDLPLGSVHFAKWLRSKHLTIGEPLVFQKYSTARLRLRAFPHDELEIVQTRSDKYGPHNVHDPSLAYGTLMEDCTRRDLTINSLYYNISTDQMLDLCGSSLHDIEHHLIRTPADPERTFDDDPLRIMRAIRFACTLGWDIDPGTWQEMCRVPHKILVASVERQRNELDKILSCPDPVRAFELMQQCGALQVVLPEVNRMVGLEQNARHHGTVWQQTLRVLGEMARKTDDPTLRLAALLHDIGKVSCGHEGKNGQMYYGGHDRAGQALIRSIMGRLRYEPKFQNEVLFLSRHHTATKRWGANGEKMTDAHLRKLQYLCGSPQVLQRLLTLIDADNLATLNLDGAQREQSPQVAAISQRLEQFDRDNTNMYEYRMPLDSMRIRKLLKIRPGKQVDRCKQYLLDQAYHNPRITPDQARTLLTQRENS